MRRMKYLLAVLLATVLSIALARAAVDTPYDQKAFAAAQQQGKPILVEVWASWCPTCAAQKPILEKLTADPAFKDLVVFRVDFDAQKPAVHAFGAQMQSTLVVFRGTAERGRSVGDTDPQSIRALLEKTQG